MELLLRCFIYRNLHVDVAQKPLENYIEGAHHLRT